MYASTERIEQSGMLILPEAVDAMSHHVDSVDFLDYAHDAAEEKKICRQNGIYIFLNGIRLKNQRIRMLPYIWRLLKVLVVILIGCAWRLR